MEIKIGKKFTQKDLDAFIEKYLSATMKTTDSNITFNLEQLEWISAEEITFLFSLMRQLVLKEKNVVVQMPITFKKFEGDDDKTVERRKITNFHLYRDWKMFQTGIKDYNFQNLVSNINELIDKKESSERTNKILPFQIIPTERDSEEAVDSRFYQKTRGQFSIDNIITNLLNNNNCYSPFENKVISDIITKELFMNSAEHAQTDESYFTTALREKWNYAHTPRFVESFVNEKDASTINFYKDKDKILPLIKKEALKIDPNKIKEKRVADLTVKSEYNIFKNQSYLEFTFIDFGCGIYETLKDEYNNKKEQSFSRLSKDIKKKHIHSQILEYAFLLDSSKDPFDNRIERADLIPRGLYFLIDMVRRYKGLLVARSGSGKVVYDFSDRIYIEKRDNRLSAKKDRIYVVKDAVISLDSKENPFFAGTMISIVLPEREKGKFRKAGVRIDDEKLNKIIYNRDSCFENNTRIEFEPKTYEYLNLSSLFNRYYLRELGKIDMLNKAYFFINEKLKDLVWREDNCVLFVDFKNIPKDNQIYKIITYLQNTPMVNEKIKLIAVNIDNADLNMMKEYCRDNFNFIGGTSFLFKAIPCLQVDLKTNIELDANNIQWIGVNNEDDDKIFTKLLLDPSDSKDISLFHEKNLCEGNVLYIENDRVQSIFSDFNKVVNKLKRGIENFADYNNLIEKAAKDKEKGILQWMLDETNKYCVMQDSIKENGEKKNALFLTSKGTYQTKYLTFYEQLSFKYTAKFFARELIDRFNYAFPDVNIDKILAVTVSSQLLAIEIIKLLGKPKDDLIKLQSYYSFENEKPYDEITGGKNVLIVNDVISTGSLIKRLIKGIEDKRSNVTGILTIADTRQYEGVDLEKEYQSEPFSKETENKIISIVASKYNKDFKIAKFKDKTDAIKELVNAGKLPDGTTDCHVKRINPILNSIVTLNTEHTEKEKILFDKPEDFFDKGQIDENIFQIGHFKQSSLSHTSFFTDMRALLAGSNGKKLLETCKNKMDEKLNVFQKEKSKPIFVFYPAHSAIEQINDDTYHDIFKTDEANIIGLQRYEVPMGWRFVFPPRRFNNVIRGQQVLIVDSGTLSGQSLVQLIDAVSIYEVSRIDVLIIIGRIDDFQREFYSRLQKLKDKRKIDKYDSEEAKKRDTIADLNIFFGTNLHILSYQTKEMCPMCREIKLLEKYQKDFKDKIPPEAQKYITYRLNEIKLQDNGSRNTSEYIPKIKGTAKYDFKELFIVRDELGKLDGHRFYEDYFKDLEKLCGNYTINLLNKNNGEHLFSTNKDNKTDLKKFEQILICLMHEPRLISTIKDLMIDLFDLLKNIIGYLINDVNEKEKLNYNWSRYATLRVYYELTGDKEFYTPQSFEKVFKFCDNDTCSLDYTSFLLSREMYKMELETKRKHYHISEILTRLNKKISVDKYSYARGVVDKLLRDPNFAVNISTVKEAFETLYKFFVDLNAKNNHADFNTTFATVEQAQDNPIIDDIQYNKYVENIQWLIREIKDNIYNCLAIIQKDDALKRCFYTIEYEKLFKNGDSVFDTLTQIMEEYNKCDLTRERKDEKVKELVALLYKFKRLHIIDSDRKQFRAFCLNRMSNIRETYLTIKNKDKFNFDKLIVKVDEENLNREMPLHKSFLYKLIEEILRNAVKYANCQNNAVELTIKTEAQSDGCCYDLIFEQNTAFDDANKRESGTQEIIKKLLDTFFPDNYNIDKTPTYVIRIKINNE
jgi:orotate phosphoribosyltransferase